MVTVPEVAILTPHTDFNLEALIYIKKINH